MSSKNADKIKRAKIVLKILNKTYPRINVPLESRNVFTLLISVLLSAQCTDVNVNNVTKDIYPKYYKPIHFTESTIYCRLVIYTHIYLFYRI